MRDEQLRGRGRVNIDGEERAQVTQGFDGRKGEYSPQPELSRVFDPKQQKKLFVKKFVIHVVLSQNNL